MLNNSSLISSTLKSFTLSVVGDIMKYNCYNICILEGGERVKQ